MLTQMLLSSAASAFLNRVVQGGQKEASAARFTLNGPEDAGSKSETERAAAVQKVFEKYDLSAISPRDIDRMAVDLQEAGFEDTEFMMSFMAHGEAFTSHMRASLAEAGYEIGPYDPTASGDLIADIEYQVRIARSFGDPTEQAEEFLQKLQQYQAQGHPAVPGARTADVSGSMAQSLVLARAMGN